MNGASVLGAFADLLAKGGIKVIDLTQPLEPATPIIKLLVFFKQKTAYEIEVLSEYDSRGPMWYWNWFKCGEHTGTHFDAPIHWVSGKDHKGNSTDTIPVER